MALIKCPECKKKVSDQCDRCPSCGYPIASNLDAVEPNKDYFAMATAFIKRMIDFIRKRKQVRIALIVTCAAFAILTIVGIVIYNAVLPKTEAYEAAVELLEEGSYKDALQEFEELGTYKDSQEKAKEAAFHHIARDVRDKVRSLWGNAYSKWDMKFSNYRYTFDDGENIVVTFHFYAYYPSLVPKVENRDVEFDMIHIKLSDYDEMLGLTDENYEQIKAEWLIFMKENYAD